MSSFRLRPVSAGSGRKEFIETKSKCDDFRGTLSFPRTRWRPERAVKHHSIEERLWQTCCGIRAFVDPGCLLSDPKVVVHTTDAATRSESL
jgi:hypothetical protein